MTTPFCQSLHYIGPPFSITYYIRAFPMWRGPVLRQPELTTGKDNKAEYILYSWALFVRLLYFAE